MKGRAAWIGGLLAALVIAGLLSPWASPLPDGLDWAARRLGFQSRVRERPLVPAPLAGYKLPAAPRAGWSTPVAGVAGTLIVFGGASLLGFLLTRHRSGSGGMRNEE